MTVQGRAWRLAVFPGGDLCSDVDAVIEGDAAQPGGVALPYCLELPVGAVSVELAEHHRGLAAGVLAEVIAGDLGAAGLVDDADERVTDLAEVLPPGLGLVDADRERSAPPRRAPRRDRP